VLLAVAGCGDYPGLPVPSPEAMQQCLVECLVQMVAAADSDALWKQLDHEVLYPSVLHSTAPCCTLPHCFARKHCKYCAVPYCVYSTVLSSGLCVRVHRC